jgi:2-octaprenyl-6-methoxyphenol hydroxylase
MQRISTDILISGGGLAGLTAACAFGTAGFDVICVDPNTPVTEPEDPAADLRTTAFLQPARGTLISAGIWPLLASHATPLQIMRIADAGSKDGRIRLIADFDAAEISHEPFGWNLPNWLLRRETLNRLGALPNVRFLPGVAAGHITPRLSEALVALSDGSRLACKLLIAADGRDSPARKDLGIGAKTWRYGQKALVFSVSHPRPHLNVSTEIHRSGGPFTLVPLPDLDGRHHSSVVWMETGARAVELAQMDVAAFTGALNARACDVLGPLTLVGRRMIWPMISRLAARLSGPRTALVAEAAHVIPPIGAQGLNMSLTDIQTLLDLARDAPDQFGDRPMLDRYHTQRWPDVKARVTGVDLLNRAAMTNSPGLMALRLKGLQTLHGVALIRKTLMRAGLGTGKARRSDPASGSS